MEPATEWATRTQTRANRGVAVPEANRTMALAGLAAARRALRATERARDAPSARITAAQAMEAAAFASDAARKARGPRGDRDTARARLAAAEATRVAHQARDLAEQWEKDDGPE